MRAKLIVCIILIVFSGNVFAKDYPAVLPLTVSESELNIWIENRGKYSQVDEQEIPLIDGVKIKGVFLEVGSGIVRINTHVYMCERSDCKLIKYNVLKSLKVSIEIDYDSSEMLIKSSDESVLSRTKYQWIEWVRNMKEQKND